MNIDTDGDGYPDINIDVDGDGDADLNIDTDIEEGKVEIDDKNNSTDINTSSEPAVQALATVVAGEDINFVVTADDMAKEKTGSNEYYEINSEVKNSKISLKSSADVTICKYDVIYKVETNTFKNQYTKADGSLGTLNNQLMIKLSGYEMKDGKAAAKTYVLDVNTIKDNKYVIKDIEIKNDVKDKSATVHDWDVNMIFRNYRDYDQINNSSKNSKSNVTFQITECRRVG